MSEIRILVTGVGSIISDSVLKCFKEVKKRKIYIVGVDIKEKVACDNIDKFYQYKKPTDDDYIDTLLSICKQEKIQFLIPLVDLELSLLAKNKEMFLENNIIICVNNEEIIKKVQNKYELYKYLEKNNIGVPTTIEFSNKEEFIKACKTLNYPKDIVCYKPFFSSGSRGFKIIDNNLDWRKYLFQEKPDSRSIAYETVLYGLDKCRDIPPMMLMEFLSGDMFNINVLANKGKVIKIAISNVVEQNLGNATKSKIVNNKEIEEYVKKVTKLLNFTGNVGFQVAYSKDKIVKLIEINPRIQGSIYLACAAGINFPYLELKMYLNEELPKIKKIKEIVLERKFKDYIIED